MSTSRRDFLKAAGALGAASLVPGSWWRLAAAGAEAPADLTTLTSTIVRGARLAEGSKGVYYRLTEGAGEPHVRRSDLGADTVARQADRRSLVNFVHFTDVHVLDAQSPARVEFLDRYADPGRGCEGVPFDGAFRPQEALTIQVLEAMIRQVRAVSVSPVTGKKIAFAVCTGDNIDNEQLNELRWFIDVMDGGTVVHPNSGGGSYEGVQAAGWGDPEYWHPDAGVADKYKQQWGFPDYPGLLEEATGPVRATGLGIPWYQTFGNHDGLAQGNAPRNPIFDGIATGPSKLLVIPPGMNPCDSFDTLRNNPAAFLGAPGRPVRADPERRLVSRAEYIAEMFKTSGAPVGHGFTAHNRATGVAYWHDDTRPGIRTISLDTVNPGGKSEGSIGAAQFAWLEQRLIEVSSRYFDPGGNEVTTGNEDRLVIVFSHHGLRSLTNEVMVPDPLEPASNDLPRFLAPEVKELLHRFPNVIVWLNGHTHDNVVVPQRDPARPGRGFWDIATAAHLDWGCQSRLVDVVDNRDGTLSIFCTILDHAGPAVPSGTDPVLKMAAIARELAANDYQAGYTSDGRGSEADRNVELVIRAPFDVSRVGRSTKKDLAPA